MPIPFRFPSLAVAIVAALAAVLCIQMAYLTGAQHARQKAAQAAQKAIAEATQAAAIAQAKIDASARRSGEVIHQTEIRVIRESANAAREIEASPGADAPIDPAVWASARAHLERLRNGAGSGDPPGDPD